MTLEHLDTIIAFVVICSCPGRAPKGGRQLRSIWKDKLTFQLISDPYPTPRYNYWTPSWLHLCGILASAALLGLGAPFWFNMLKTLTNLRPVLATKEQQQQKRIRKKLRTPLHRYDEEFGL
jgi:hypothetical protein